MSREHPIVALLSGKIRFDDAHEKYPELDTPLWKVFQTLVAAKNKKIPREEILRLGKHADHL